METSIIDRVPQDLPIFVFKFQSPKPDKQLDYYNEPGGNSDRQAIAAASHSQNVLRMVRIRLDKLA